METAFKRDLGHLGVPHQLREIADITRVSEEGFASLGWLDLALASDSPSTPTQS